MRRCCAGRAPRPPLRGKQPDFFPERGVYIDFPEREGGGQQCFLKEKLQPLATKAEGFKWVIESENKPGFVSLMLDDAIEIAIPVADAYEVNGTLGTVNIGYLKSYDQMGGARATCLAGCICKPTDLWGSHNFKASVIHIGKGIPVGEDRNAQRGEDAPAACIMRIDRKYSGQETYVDKMKLKENEIYYEVPPPTGPGKFKITGVFFSVVGAEMHHATQGLITQWQQSKEG